MKCSRECDEMTWRGRRTKEGETYGVRNNDDTIHTRHHTYYTTHHHIITLSLSLSLSHQTKRSVPNAMEVCSVSVNLPTENPLPPRRVPRRVPRRAGRRVLVKRIAVMPPFVLRPVVQRERHAHDHVRVRCKE